MAHSNLPHQPSAQRTSDREYVVARAIGAGAQAVFDAWTKPAIFRQWWVPAGAPMELLTCEMDVRVGGTYRLVFRFGDQTMAFFGKYLEVVPGARLVWTNEEGVSEAAAITTVTLSERDGSTLVEVTDAHPSKAALDEAIETGATEGMPVQLAQLDALLAIAQQH